ncbi:MAG: methylmalonyl Co-A mutase-associated GTPase MeaB [Nitrospiraceae bacterium]
MVLPDVSPMTSAPPAGDVATMVEQVKAGSIRAVARVITWLENGGPIGAAVSTLLPPRHGRGNVIGVTGYPGAGKSTLIGQLIAAYRRLDMTVGVLAVDISSKLTGGALLGDRIRMQEWAADAGVYIRSMATRGHAGGVARATGEAVRVLEAAGYEVVLIETIGVGQGELDIMEIADTVVAVVAPGLGDEVQAMKAGLLEVAHIVVVNKGDRPGAETTLRDLREWCPSVLRVVATTGEGVGDLLALVAERRRMRDLTPSGARSSARVMRQ